MDGWFLLQRLNAGHGRHHRKLEPITSNPLTLSPMNPIIYKPERGSMPLISAFPDCLHDPSFHSLLLTCLDKRTLLQCLLPSSFSISHTNYYYYSSKSSSLPQHWLHQLTSGTSASGRPQHLLQEKAHHSTTTLSEISLTFQPRFPP